MRRAIMTSILATIGVIALVLGFTTPAVGAESTGTVRGTLSDSLGGLLVRDETRITVALYRDDELNTPALTQDLVSSGFGSFEIANVPVGRYSVKFDSHDGGHVGEWWGDTRRAAERAFIQVVAGGTVTLDSRLSETVALTGAVSGRDALFAPVGDPIQVVATSGDSELDAWLPHRTSTASMPGTYWLRVLPGTYDMTFTDDTGAHHPLTVADVVATAPSTTEDVVLAAARASLSGKVSVRTSAGIVPATDGFTVLYRWSASEGKWSEAQPCGQRTSDSFFLDCLPAGRYKLLFRYKDVTTFWGGGDLLTAPEIELGDEETRVGVDLVIDDPATVNGVIAVRLENGTIIPIDSAGVAVWRKMPSGDFTEIPGAAAGYGPDGVTAGDGAFSAPLPPGTYVFRASRGGSEFGATYLEGSRFLDDAPRITLGLGEQRDLGTIVLPRSSFDITRIAGSNRFATAVAVSQQVIPDSERAPVVYLTNAFNFPDALAAGPAAMRAGGVILPVTKDALPATIVEELKRLQPVRVVLAGGTGVISETVRSALTTVVPADTTIDRIGGANRYETSDLIVRDAFSAKGSTHAFIASGAAFPDALAAGPAAGHLDAPVILVPGGGALPPRTIATISALGITDVYIAGGTGAVSPAIETSLRKLLGTSHVIRLAGPDRVSTAIEINDAIFGSTDNGYVASARGFADALSGGALAARQDAPLYLTGPQCLSFYTVRSLRDRQIARLTILGGTSVLGPGIAKLSICG